MNLKLYCTYHSANLIDEYNLKDDEIHTHFPSYDTSINGTNINYTNPILCEVVTLYYVWKNRLFSEFVGFEHYRRKFDTKNISELYYNQCYVQKLLHDDRPIKYSFYVDHYAHTYNMCLFLLKYKYNNIELYNTMNSTVHFIPFNNFIMSYDKFEEMCEIVFPILFDLDTIYNGEFSIDKYVKIFNDNHYDARQLAFLAERLISCYIITYFGLDNIIVQDNDE